RTKMLPHALGDHRNVRQTPRPFLPLRQRAARRVDDVDATTAKRLEVLNDRRMLQHRPVHRGRDLDLAAMRNCVRRQSVVSDAAGNAEDDVHRSPFSVARSSVARSPENRERRAANYSVSSSAVVSSAGGVSCHFTWFLSISSIATRVGFACLLFIFGAEPWMI